MEKVHKSLFQTLWTNYNFKQYIRERLKRYLIRIKINNLKKFITNKKVIDFGCGHGNFLVACYLNNAKYCVGIDYGRQSIAYANKILKILQLDKKKIKFEVGSVYKSYKKKNFFDFAIQNGVFHHLENEIEAYKEVHRVLKKNAFFFCIQTGVGG